MTKPASKEFRIATLQRNIDETKVLERHYSQLMMNAWSEAKLCRDALRSMRKVMELLAPNFVVSIVIITLMLTGCSHYQSALRKGAEADIANYEAGMELARATLTTWTYNSSLIRESLGPQLEIPELAGIKSALDRGDKIVASIDGEPTDEQIAGILGVRVRLYVSFTTVAANYLTPMIVDALKAMALL